MTMHGEALLEEAIGTWQQDRPIDMVMFSQLVQEGYDVPKLEAIYRTEEA